MRRLAADASCSDNFGEQFAEAGLRRLATTAFRPETNFTMERALPRKNFFSCVYRVREQKRL